MKGKYSCPTWETRDAETEVHDGGTTSFPLKRGSTGPQVQLHNSIIGNFRDAGERWNDGSIAPCPFEKSATGEEVPVHNRIAGSFMVYKDRLEAILGSYSRTHKIKECCFSIISAIIFEVHIIAAQKRA